MSSAVKRRKALGLWTGLALVVGNMVGASAYLLPSTMAQYGPISLFGWLVAGAGALSLAAVFARMGRIMPAEGGHYAYTREAFGDFPAFLVAWGYWVSVWVGNATIAVSFVGYFTAFVPAAGATPVATAATALASIWILTALNVWGLREAALFQLVTTVLKVLPLIAVGTIGLLALDASNLVPVNQSGGSATGAVTAATVFALWAFLGFESATVPADEVEDAERTIPRVTLWGTLATTAVYLLSTLAVMGVMSATEIGASTYPVAEAAQRMWGGWAGMVVAAGAALAGFAVLNGWVLMQGQMPLAPARDGLFPAVFGRLSPRGTPTFGLLLSSGLCTLLVLANYTRGLLGLFEFALLLSTVVVLVPYAFTSAAQIALVLREPERWGGPDRGRALFTSVLGLVFALMAIVWAGWSSILWGAVLLAGGVPIYLWSVRRRANAGDTLGSGTDADL